MRGEEDIRGRSYLDFVSRKDEDRVRHLLRKAIDGEASRFEFSSNSTTQPRHFTSCFVPLPGANGKTCRLVGITTDITEHKEAETGLTRLNRTYAVLSACNNSLARSVDEHELLSSFCRTLVEIGGYAFAWVGYAKQDADLRLSMKAHSGHRDAKLPAAVVAWANTLNNPSPCRTAVLTGQPVVFRDIKAEPELSHWRKTAKRLGFRSVIALPLKAGSSAIGNFSIFSAAGDAFTEQEVALLTDLAKDLAFGIESVQASMARAQKVRHLREEAEHDERRRIAAILHDGVGQSMQAVNLGLKRLRAMADGAQPLVTDALNRIIAEVGDVIRSLRNVSHELRPLFLEHMELPEAVRFHCREMDKLSDINIGYSASELPCTPNERAKEQCFLSFREALSNAVKHSKATRIEVTMVPEPSGSLTLLVTDNGIGFDPKKRFNRPAGLGLSMIRERAESVGGHAEIRSSPGKRTEVRITVPLITEQLKCR